ncbi:putative C-type lectin domain family 20 member A [Hemibagrus wyckioides]|uniref:putative C-type lectin domain family 20 member A n=1 Tax=Hemibagrus wyckioides TaxID=337641 RepID=UPI00266CE917|nr:putative C-type lectin domain family 20 member A [Hemibagrus wyckioides]
MTDWYAGDPTYKVEDCAALHSQCWFDISCSATLAAVCFDAKNTGSSRYIVISTTMTFNDAQSYCRQHYTDLTNVTTVEENTIIKGKVTGSSWIGLFRDIWMWVDKSNFSAFGWLRGSPWGVGQNDNCGSIVNGLVDAALCSDILPFYCLREFTKKQIIRIKIRSNQDVNDPAVKAAILQKIKQKLEEHGISNNSTIKWREQPDGMVF